MTKIGGGPLLSPTEGRGRFGPCPDKAVGVWAFILGTTPRPPPLPRAPRPRVRVRCRYCLPARSVARHGEPAFFEGDGQKETVLTFDHGFVTMSSEDRDLGIL